MSAKYSGHVAHTFLFREGDWQVTGEFTSGDGSVSPADGEARIKHLSDRWLFESLMRLHGAKTVESSNRYEINPFAPGSLATHWIAQNPTIGTQHGRFVVVGDTILSFYATATGRHRGYECLVQRDKRKYSARGVTMHEDKLVGTWAVELKLKS
jgi:hypothetical protein